MTLASRGLTHPLRYNHIHVHLQEISIRLCKRELCETQKLQGKHLGGMEMTRKVSFSFASIIFVAAILLTLVVITTPQYKDYIGSQTSAIKPNRVDRELDKLPWGHAALNNPKSIAYGQSAVVQLLLSGSKSGEQLLTFIDEAGEARSYRVRFNNDMEAHLVGSAFEITPITQERQIVKRNGLAEWKWEVRPKQLGQHTLFLSLSANVMMDGREAKHTVQTMQRTLEVDVVWPHSVWYFFSNYWQWSMTAIAFPLFTWLITKLVRRRKKR
jgi:hypothetical protein